MTAPKSGYVRVYQKQPGGGYKIVRVHQSKLTKEQLAAAHASPLNKVSSTGASEPAEPAGPTAEQLDQTANTAYMTDPIYQSERADLDYERNLAKRDYDRLMGVDGSGGEIKQNWQSAIDALTRGTRGSISSANAGLGAANLAGSGIARKSLQDIGAEFTAAKLDKDTERTRLENQAVGQWADFTTRFGAKDLAGQREAINRWKEYNQSAYDAASKPKPVANPVAKKDPAVWGSGPVKPATRNPVNFNPFAHAPAPAPGKAKAPKGKKYVKNPVTGKYTLKAV